MKTHIDSLLLTLFSICLIAACDVNESDSELKEEQFEASFFTDIVINSEDPDDPEASGPLKGGCTEEPFTFFNVQEGSGQATHLDNLFTRITFCVDTADLQDDGTLTGDESTPYNNGQGIFKDANGDELHFTIEGAVLPSDHPDYDFEFQDPFTFTGGTGRFAGASGSGTTDSFVNHSTNRTDHTWNATLIFNP